MMRGDYTAAGLSFAAMVPVAGWAATAGKAGRRGLRRQREKQRGTMQGGALSPLLANIYLHPFDLAITSQGFRMVRFMDDFVIMCASREDAEQAMELARKQLATLRLVLNEEKTQIVNYEDGLEFLGQALVPRQRHSVLSQGWTSFAEAAEALRRSSVHALKRSGSKKGTREHFVITRKVANSAPF